MARIAPRWDDATGGEFKLLDEGTYTAKVDSSDSGEIRISKNGNEYINVDFNVEGIKVRRNFMLTGKGVYFLEQFLKAMGLSHDEDEILETDDWHGKTVGVKVIQKTSDTGKTRNEIAEIFPAKGKRLG